MISRRELLQTSGAVIPIGTFMPSVFSRALDQLSLDRPYGAAPSTNNKTLIIIQMAGGNDGLNTVVPYAQGKYHDYRPVIGVPEANVLPLSDQVGLNDQLADIKKLYDAGHVAVMQNVGYDNPSLSHFQAMDIWESADPMLKSTNGWLSTLVEGQVDSNGHPIGSLSLGPQLAPALCCTPTPPPAFSNVNAYRLLPDPHFPKDVAAREDALVKLYQSYNAPAPYAALMESTADSARTSSAEMQRIAVQYQSSVPYPNTPLAQGLKLFAASMKQGSGLRIGYVVLGGFDTHSQQLNQQPKLLKQLNDAVYAFYTDLAAQQLDNDVVVMTWSEFGRRVQENASHGTDHGTAAPLFMIGSPVRGGLYGDVADLTNLVEANLKFSIDFRSVYSTVIERWFQADSKPILGAAYPTIDVVG